VLCEELHADVSERDSHGKCATSISTITITMLLNRFIFLYYEGLGDIIIL
jgi:hypothetical protein